ncbi:Defensin-like protein 182 [Raphanus sativus]|nr:Defensin-like protein 182 [Raphanus sativus]
MERSISYVLFVTFFVMSALVMTEGQGNLCRDGLGTCENCDQKCKTKHGPSSQSNCDHSVGVALCTCFYQCTPPKPSPPPTRPTCNNGTTLCTECSDNCCDTNCAKSNNGGHRIGNSIAFPVFLLLAFGCLGSL